MSIEEFKKSLRNARINFEAARKTGLGWSIGSIARYDKQKAESNRNAYKTAITTLEQESKALHNLRDHVSGNEEQIDRIAGLVLELKSANEEQKIASILAEISERTAQIQAPITIRTATLNVPGVQEEIDADKKELEKCFTYGCYRSTVVLCGRILETALHRKYYEKTGQDLLEKAPGIGLGNLIAKMTEAGIKMDPAMANQIHLINQVRIHSIHKKQEPFNPTKDQTTAIMLYTFDVIKKLFNEAKGI
ncbi:DUF4145 domain-containing protein [Candidatus Woesearchaeota archaeon]|nr:DUF4145 domain-containing protein [Candidatus Woesearchaeota archaeon]